MSGALARLQRWDRGLARVETGLLAFLLFGSLAAALLQIVLRNAAGIALPGVDTAVRRALLWIALLGASLATHRGSHLAVDVADQLLGGGERPAGGAGRLRSRLRLRRLRRMTAAAAHGLAAVVTAVLTVAALRFARLEWGFGGPAAAAVTAVLPAGFAIMTVRFALVAWASGLGLPPHGGPGGAPAGVRDGAPGDAPGDAGDNRSAP